MRKIDRIIFVNIRSPPTVYTRVRLDCFGLSSQNEPHTQLFLYVRFLMKQLNITFFNVLTDTLLSLTTKLPAHNLCADFTHPRAKCNGIQFSEIQCRQILLCGMYQRKVDLDMLNAIKIKLADVSSVSP